MRGCGNLRNQSNLPPKVSRTISPAGLRRSSPTFCEPLNGEVWMPGQPTGEAQGEPYSPGEFSDPVAPSTRRFTGRAVDYGAFRPVVALVEEQADLHPDRPAVSYDGRTLGYRRLDELVSGLANTLDGLGVRKGDVVPLLLVNSLEMPVTYLALMKLGAAFVPLDPAWPDDRLRGTFGVLPAGLVLCAALDSVPPEMR